MDYSPKGSLEASVIRLGAESAPAAGEEVAEQSQGWLGVVCPKFRMRWKTVCHVDV